jgi:protein-S-isoprenylcysteine O-methyltransferase Ste14
MKKLTTLGIGPKIGMVALPYAALAILLSIYFSPTFAFSVQFAKQILIAGIVVTSIGFLFYVVTVVMLMKGVKNTKLMTAGTYFLCQNPLYASMILLLIPGLSLLLNSWLILTTSLVAYIMFKINIHTEYAEMEAFFGEPYREYRKTTPELFPFPFKKIFGNN